MTVVTYAGNADPHERTSKLELRGGNLEVALGQAADLTDEEIGALSTRYILTPGGTLPADAPEWAPAFADENGNIARQVPGGSTLLAVRARADFYSPLDYGYVGDGTADDAPSIQAAHDAAKNSSAGHGTLELPNLPCTIKSSLSFDLRRITVAGARGTYFNCTGLAAGPALTLTSSNDSVDGAGAGFGESVASLASIRMKGPGMTSTVDGVMIVGGASNAARFAARNMAISDFRIGVQNGSNAYGWAFDNCEVWACGTGIYMPFGLSNAGENLTFSNSFIYNCNFGVSNSSAGCDIVLMNCRVDYMLPVAGRTAGNIALPASRSLTAFAGRIVMIGGHLEDNQADYWVATGDETSAIKLIGTEIVLGANRPGAQEVFLSEQVVSDPHHAVWYGGIVLQAVSWHAQNRVYAPQCLVGGGGRVSVSGLTFEHPQDFGVSTDYPAIASSLSVADGTFESAGSLAAWKLTSSTAVGDQPALDATTFFAGTQSLKFAVATTGHFSFAFQNFTVRPGDMLLAAYYLKTSGLAAAGTSFALTFTFLDANSNQTRVVAYTFNTDFDWTQQKITPLLVSPGEATVQVGWKNGSNFPTGAAVWLDKLIMNNIR